MAFRSASASARGLPPGPDASHLLGLCRSQGHARPDGEGPGLEHQPGAAQGRLAGCQRLGLPAIESGAPRTLGIPNSKQQGRLVSARKRLASAQGWEGVRGYFRGPNKIHRRRGRQESKETYQTLEKLGGPNPAR